MVNSLASKLNFSLIIEVRMFVFDSQNTFVVSLLHQEKRRHYVSTHFRERGISFTFIDAIYGKKLTNQELETVSSTPLSLKQIYRKLGLGEIGCALSHKLIYKKIIEEDIQYALIFEDDVILNDSIFSHLDSISSLPETWDVLFLGQHCFFSRNISVKTNFWSRGKKRNWLRPIENCYGAYAYVISKKGAQKLNEMTHVLSRPIDHYVGDWKRNSIYISSSNSATVLESYIDGEGIGLERQELVRNLQYPKMEHWLKRISIKIYRRMSKFLPYLNHVNKIKKDLLTFAREMAPYPLAKLF